MKWKIHGVSYVKANLYVESDVKPHSFETAAVADMSEALRHFFTYFVAYLNVRFNQCLITSDSEENQFSLIWKSKLSSIILNQTTAKYEKLLREAATS